MIKRFTEVKQNGSDAQSIPIGTSAEYITLNDGSVLQEVLGDINLAEDGSIKEQIQDIKQITDSLDSTYAPMDSPNLNGSVSINGTLSATSWTGNLPIDGILTFQGNSPTRTIDIGIPSTNFQIIPSSGLSGLYLKDFGNNTNAISITSGNISTIYNFNAPNVAPTIKISNRTDLFNFISDNANSNKLFSVRLDGKYVYPLVTGNRWSSSVSSSENIESVGFARVLDSSRMMYYFFRGSGSRAELWVSLITRIAETSTIAISSYNLATTTSKTIDID